MTIRFDDKVAIVTGAGGGLGRQHALEFARRGAKVVVNDLGGALDGSGGASDAANAVVEEIKAEGGEAIANGSSVSDRPGVATMVDETMEKWGRIDILVNNAGILRDKSFHKMTLEEWDMVLDVHLQGSVNTTHAIYPIMREQGYGRIIHTSSSSGLFGNFGQVNYGAAKEGIAGFTRSLALEVAKYKCTVNTISPGAATRLTIDLMEAAGREYDENDWTQGPEQIAPVVAWLCTEEAIEITSQIIHSQGGILGIMQQPAIIQSFTTDNLWTLDQLDSLIPELIETKKYHDQEVAEKGAPKKV